MRNYKYTLILLLISFQLFSQDDSLDYLIQHASGIEQYDLIIKQTEGLGWGDGEKIINNGNQVLQLAKLTNDNSKIAESYKLIGLGNSFLNNYNIAIEYYFKALQIWESESLSNKVNIKLGEINFLISEIYQSLENYTLAAKFLEKSLNYYKQTSDKGIAKTINGIALNYYQQDNNDTALIYFSKLLSFYENLTDSIGIAGVYNNRGMVYMNLQDYGQAFDNYTKALYLYSKLGDKRRQSVTLFNLATIEGKLQNYSEKIKYLNEAINILESVKFHRGVVKVQMSLATHYLYYETDFTKVEFYLKKALFNAEKYEFKDFIIDIYQLYSDLNVIKGNYKKAYEYEQINKLKRDSLYKKNMESIAEMRMKYETEKRRKEQELWEKETKIKELSINKQKNLRNYLISFLILALILVIVIYSRYKLKQKTNKLLTGQKQQLEIANITKDKFFSIIAHDLKNPMAASYSLCDLLYENYRELSDEQKYETICTIKKSTAFTYELLENLLQWSLSQSGRMKFDPKKINIENIISNNISLLAGSAQKKDINLISIIDKNILVFGDENMISLIIRNLVSNAIKFSNPGDEIKVNADVVDGYITISIEDNGIGMSKEDLEKLFRIDVNTTTIGKSKEKGTGLGLILCKEFVEKNGGKIWVESELGKGSIFSFTLKKAET
ncbi:MAG: hypothetical protein B6D61_10045 [Bacteroidetes bacterium 4484_249]|nr:MAG: hypothetical protein B6D61_10045 [Bacteroidetes bacterium 4484_249]